MFIYARCYFAASTYGYLFKATMCGIFGMYSTMFSAMLFAIGYAGMVEILNKKG